MALAQQIANYDEFAVGANHPNLADTHNRAFLKDHDQYGAHTKFSVANLINGDGSTLTTGMVVVLTTSSLTYSRTTTQGDTRQVLVVEDSIINGGSGYTAHAGYVADLMVQGAVAINDILRTSTTTGRAESGGTTGAVTGGFAVSLTTNASGAGTVKAILFGFTNSSDPFTTVTTPVRAIGTAYQPSTTRSTMVTVVVQSDGTNALTGECLSDSANPPTVSRAKCQAHVAATEIQSMTFAVLKSHYYKITLATGTIIEVNEWN